MQLVKKIIILILFIVSGCKALDVKNKYGNQFKYIATYNANDITLLINKKSDCSFNFKIYSEFGIKIAEIELKDSINIKYVIDDSYRNLRFLKRYSSFQFCDIINSILLGFDCKNNCLTNNLFQKEYFLEKELKIVSEKYSTKGKFIQLEKFDVLYDNDKISFKRIK